MPGRHPQHNPLGRRLFAAVTAAALLTGVCVSEPAYAQSDADKATARNLADEAKVAFDAGNFAKAEELFGRAASLVDAPTLKLALARAQAKNMHLVAASETYKEIIRRGVKSGDPPPFKTALSEAKSELNALEPRIPNLVLSIRGGDNPTVRLDGAPYPMAALGIKRVIDPGQHTVTAEAPGFAPASQAFQVGEGATEKVELILQPMSGPGPLPPVGAPPPGDQPPPDEAGDGGSSPLVPIGWVLTGVGGVGLALGGVFGILAISEQSELEENCDEDECPTDQRDVLDTYRTNGNVSTIAFIAGGVLAAVGITLIIVAPDDDSPTVGHEGGVTVSVAPAPNGVFLQGTF